MRERMRNSRATLSSRISPHSRLSEVRYRDCELSCLDCELACPLNYVRSCLHRLLFVKLYV